MKHTLRECFSKQTTPATNLPPVSSTWVFQARSLKSVFKKFTTELSENESEVPWQLRPLISAAGSSGWQRNADVCLGRHSTANGCTHRCPCLIQITCTVGAVPTAFYLCQQNYCHQCLQGVSCNDDVCTNVRVLTSKPGMRCQQYNCWHHS